MFSKVEFSTVPSRLDISLCLNEITIRKLIAFHKRDILQATKGLACPVTVTKPQGGFRLRVTGRIQAVCTAGCLGGRGRIWKP